MGVGLGQPEGCLGEVQRHLLMVVVQQDVPSVSTLHDLSERPPRLRLGLFTPGVQAGPAAVPLG